MSSPIAETALNLEIRVRELEGAIGALRGTMAETQREVSVLRADLERLRVETERATGTKTA